MYQGIMFLDEKTVKFFDIDGIPTELVQLKPDPDRIISIPVENFSYVEDHVNVINNFIKTKTLKNLFICTLIPSFEYHMEYTFVVTFKSDDNDYLFLFAKTLPQITGFLNYVFSKTNLVEENRKLVEDLMFSLLIDIYIFTSVENDLDKLSGLTARYFVNCDFIKTKDLCLPVTPEQFENYKKLIEIFREKLHPSFIIDKDAVNKIISSIENRLKNISKIKQEV